MKFQENQIDLMDPIVPKNESFVSPYQHILD